MCVISYGAILVENRKLEDTGNFNYLCPKIRRKGGEKENPMKYSYEESKESNALLVK